MVEGGGGTRKAAGYSDTKEANTGGNDAENREDPHGDSGKGALNPHENGAD